MSGIRNLNHPGKKESGTVNGFGRQKKNMPFTSRLLIHYFKKKNGIFRYFISAKNGI